MTVIEKLTANVEFVLVSYFVLDPIVYLSTSNQTNDLVKYQANC